MPDARWLCNITNRTRKSYECKDGIWFQMLGSGGSTRAQLPRLIDALGLTETLLPLPEGFWSPPHEGAEEVVSAIRERFSEMDSVEVGARFAELDVWATVVNTPASLLEDERALQLGAFFRPEGAGSAEALKERGNPFKAEALHLLRSPMNLGGSAFVAPARAPMLGQHTEAVLMEQLGYSKEQAREAMGKHGQD
jgi:crotonobetainyl-CoA:carnitine CoA-transferase CaiB-like acyl-CoA transferase